MKARYYVVASTHLKNISQIGNLPQVEMKIKNIWNHRLGYHLTPSFISKSLFAASETWCRPANVEASRVKLFSERAKRPVMPFNRAFKGRVTSTSHDRDFYHAIFCQIVKWKLNASDGKYSLWSVIINHPYEKSGTSIKNREKTSNGQHELFHPSPPASSVQKPFLQLRGDRPWPRHSSHFPHVGRPTVKHSSFVKFHLQKVSAQPFSALFCRNSCCLKSDFTGKRYTFWKTGTLIDCWTEGPRIFDRLNSAISGETAK